MFPGHFREHQLWETQNRAAILSLRRNGKPLADTYRQFPKFRNFVFLPYHFVRGGLQMGIFRTCPFALDRIPRLSLPKLSSEKP
jgi:hypothetical protein